MSPRPLKRALAFSLIVAAAATAQQPNLPASKLTVNFVDGPSYPTFTTARNNQPAMIEAFGSPASRVLVAFSSTGFVQPFSAVLFGDKLDLPFSPPVNVWVNGFFGPGASNFVVDSTGVLQMPIFVPSTVAVGANFALQAAMDDLSSPFGVSLTAATSVAITQGPVTTTLTFSNADEGWASINLGAAGVAMPFYGVSYNWLHVCTNGYLVPSTSSAQPAADFTPTASEFASQTPRIALFWCDQILGAGTTVISTIDAAPPPGSFANGRIDFNNIVDYPAPGGTFNYSFFFDVSGAFEIIHAGSMTPSAFYTSLIGAGAGANLGPSPSIPKDLSAYLLAAGVGATNENFFEMFNPIGQSNGFSSYDLSGSTLHFLPIGPGVLPGSTNAYLVY